MGCVTTALYRDTAVIYLHHPQTQKPLRPKYHKYVSAKKLADGLRGDVVPVEPDVGVLVVPVQHHAAPALEPERRWP